MVFCFGLTGLLLGVCAIGYVDQTPAALTPEQETAIVAGAAEWEICKGVDGGCEKAGSRPAVISCPPGVGVGGICGQPSWSEDDTANKDCVDASGTWWWFGCSVLDPYHCKRRFTTCLATGTCSGTTTGSGSGTARNCW